MDPTPERHTSAEQSSCGRVLGTVFTVGEARAAGMTEHQLRDPRLRAPTPGIRVWDGVDRPWIENVRAVSALDGEHYLSHSTAARLWGLWLPRYLEADWPVHVTGRQGMTGARRRPGIAGHRAVLQEDDVTDVDGFRLTTPARTWLDLATLIVRQEDLVAAGDSLLQREERPSEPEAILGRNPLSSLGEVDAVMARRRRTKGITAARQARELMRPGVDSAPETHLRMIIINAGLPEPVVNEEVWLSRTVKRRPDLHYPQWRIAIQYDGDGHSRPGQLTSDIDRDDDFMAHGWESVKAGRDIYTRHGERKFLGRLHRAIRTQTGQA